MLKELTGCKLLAIAQFNDFGYVLHHINNLELIIKLQAILRIITKAYSFTNINGATIGLYFAHQHFDKSRFTRTVVPHNTHLLISRKDV